MCLSSVSIHLYVEISQALMGRPLSDVWMLVGALPSLNWYIPQVNLWEIPLEVHHPLPTYLLGVAAEV